MKNPLSKKMEHQNFVFSIYYKVSLKHDKHLVKN